METTRSERETLQNKFIYFIFGKLQYIFLIRLEDNTGKKKIKPYS